MCQQHFTFFMQHVFFNTCYNCRRFWAKLHATIHSYQLYLASPEVNLFNSVRLNLNAHGIGPSDDFLYLMACRRMGSCYSACPVSKSNKLLTQHDRRCRNGSTNMASLHTLQGRKGINQDAMLVWEGDDSIGDIIVCGVFDGHGPFGHLVAQIVRDSLPLKLVTSWQAIKSSVACKEDSSNHKACNEGGGLSDDLDVLSLWKQLFVSSYKSMDKELLVNSTINCFSSGTTAVILIKQGYDIVIGNVGDSRAILGTKSDDGSTLAVQLTVDLKPDLPKEADRIRKRKGRVFALHGEAEVHRVWLPHINFPGLAMARVLGDFCLKEFGVIAVPEVIHRRLTEKDQFIVLATDGVWDVLSNEQVVQIVSSVSERQLAARAVVETAVHFWRIKCPVSKTDDCAAVCLYVNDEPNGSCLSSSEEQDVALNDRQQHHM